MRTLVLAMGNDILGDDGVALHAARRLPAVCIGQAEVMETAEAGLALLELITGYDRLLILDSIRTGAHPPGTVLHLPIESFHAIEAPSPHYAGLPDVLALAERIGVPMPGDIKVLAMEIENPFEIRERLSPCVVEALPAYVADAAGILLEWERKSDYAHIDVAVPART